MAEIALTAGLTVSDRTRPLIDGRVTIPGVALEVAGGALTEIFRQVDEGAGVALSEQSMGSHILATARGSSGYYGLPVFLSRNFRHHAIQVRAGSGIATPADLAGRSIGVPRYQQTAGIWVRGLLRDMYGVDTKKIRWRVGAEERWGERDPSVPKLPAGFDVQPVTPGVTLVELVKRGEIDGVVVARRLSIGGEGGLLQPLIRNRRAAEEDYFRATGFLPIMHVAVIRKDIADAHPELPAAVTRAFMAAKRFAAEELMLGNFARHALPWMDEHARQVRAVMGANPWRYGFRESLAELAAMTRYCAEDGLIATPLDPAALFHPSTLDIADGV